MLMWICKNVYKKAPKIKEEKRNFKSNLIDHSAFMPSNTLIPFDRIIWYD